MSVPLRIFRNLNHSSRVRRLCQKLVKNFRRPSHEPLGSADRSSQILSSSLQRQTTRSPLPRSWAHGPHGAHWQHPWWNPWPTNPGALLFGFCKVVGGHVSVIAASQAVLPETARPGASGGAKTPTSQSGESKPSTSQWAMPRVPGARKAFCTTRYSPEEPRKAFPRRIHRRSPDLCVLEAQSLNKKEE